MAGGAWQPEAFEQLVRRHENRLYRTALAMMRNKADAEDMVQEAFLRAYQKAPVFQSEDHEKAWLIRVTVNLCHSLMRSPWQKRRVPFLDDYPAQEPAQKALVDEVMLLPIKYRTVIHLYYFEGYPVKTIAMLTGQKESTVKSQLSRARQKLKTCLEEDSQ